MAYSYDQIIQAYTALHVGKAPDAATADSLRLTASMNANGQLADAQVLNILMNGADSTTAVAVMSYQFFTGKSPTAAGLTYLVNSPINANDLSDPAYAKFNLENRYINFAANLGLYGEGATAFANKYGAMDFDSYVASIYQTVIGRSYAEAASVNVDAAIAYLISTKANVLQAVRESGLVTDASTAAQTDLAVKAAMAGLVMAAAIKADVGLYAAATDNFMVALTQGNAVYNTDITQTYRPSFDTPAHGTGHAIDRAPVTLPNSTPPVTPPPVVTSFTLGAGANNITGSAGNDTFTATNATLHNGDVLNGGSGNDVLNITATGNIAGNVTVSNIETINLTVTGNTNFYPSAAWTGITTVNANVTSSSLDMEFLSNTADFTVVTSAVGAHNTQTYGGHNVTITATGSTTGNLNASNATGDIVITRTNVGNGSHGGTGGDGGTTVKITTIADPTGIANGDSQTTGGTGWYGGPNTTSVEFLNPTPVTATGASVGIIGNQNSVLDYNTDNRSGLGTITTIKISGFGNLASYIEDNALTDLTLAHGSGTVELDNGYHPGGSATSLNLTVNDLTGVILHEGAGIYTSVNVTTGATASSVELQMAGLTTLTVGDSGSLTLTNLAADAPSLHTATVNGTASLTATFGAGADTINLGAGASVINTGAGNDQIIVTAANAASNTVYSTLTVSAGADTLKINAQGGAAAFTGRMGAMATGVTFQDYLNSAASGDGHTTSQWGWFQFGGDTYVVLDSSASATFQPGTDIVVKLVGAFNELNAGITAGVLTIV